MAVDGPTGAESGMPGFDVVTAAGRVVQRMQPDGACAGTLVVHLDGTAAACSEELDGRCCAGADHHHLGVISCRDLLGLGGCEECTAAAGSDARSGDDPEWRHALRVGVVATRRPRCRRHRPTR